MKYIISRKIKKIEKYWNTCGWSDVKHTARVYTEPEAYEIFEKMIDSGINARMVPLKGSG